MRLVILATLWVFGTASIGPCLAAEEILLWPQGAPGSVHDAGAEVIRVTDDGEHVISNVHRPAVTPYLPPADQATGTALVIAPGGGHRELWSDHEGHHLAKWLQSRGIAAFVLKYRLEKTEGANYSVDDHAVADLQRALRLVRNRAAEWQVNPQRVGAIGFSAGGELVALAGMRFDAGDPNAVDALDRQSCRPDFQCLIYPGRSGRYAPHQNSPPAFIVCGFKDRADISSGMAQVYIKFKEVNVPTELHVYANAGHGFGFRERNQGAIAGWPSRLEEWLVDMNMLERGGSEG